MWLQGLEKRPDLLGEMSKVWGKLARTIKKPGELCLARWGRVKGPATAILATMHERGWTMGSPWTFTDPQGGTWDLSQALNLHEPLLQYWRDDLEKGVWRAAAHSRLGAGLQEGADFTEAKKFLARLREAGQNKEAGLLECIVCAGLWTERRLCDTNRIDSSRCRRCGQEGADEVHHFWDCPDNANIQDDAVTATNHLRFQAAEQRDVATALWARGVTPTAKFPLVPSPPEEEHLCIKVCQQGRHQELADLDDLRTPNDHHDNDDDDDPMGFGFGMDSPRHDREESPHAPPPEAPITICTDGSGGAQQHHLLRRCGWGFAVYEGEKLLETWSAPLPGHHQTVPRAELYAIVQALESDHGQRGDVTLYTDHENHVKKIEKWRDHSPS
jgi:hypothetical protein